MATLIYDEMKLFLICLMLGMQLAVCYDIVRIFRQFIRHKAWVIDVEDLLFWLFTAWRVFETLFRYNRGALRAYAFFGMFFGVIIYMLTISGALMKAVGHVVPYWKKLLHFLVMPFSYLKESVRKILKNISAQVKMAVKSR